MKINQAKLDRVLVVLSPDLIKPTSPQESSLLKRAVELAQNTGCELELFHVCHEPSLDQKLFASDEDVAAARREIADQDATLLSELMVRLNAQDVTLKCDVVWHDSRTDAILRKIAVSRPDLVIKQSREHSYAIGLLDNTDWDLVRQSPVNVWFVSDRQPAIDNMVAAVGTVSGEQDIISAPDYAVFQTAKMLASAFESEIYPVHAYPGAGRP